MKPEKMTDEELRQARAMADVLNEDGTSTLHRLLAHIAALTAERDALARFKTYVHERCDAADVPTHGLPAPTCPTYGCEQPPGHAGECDPLG